MKGLSSGMYVLLTILFTFLAMTLQITPSRAAATSTVGLKAIFPVVPPDITLRTNAIGSPTFSYRNQTITEDIVWSGEVLVEEGVVIAPQTTLTIEPGTVVRFRRNDLSEGQLPALLIQGRCMAVGTKERPIRFTSQFTTLRQGDWQGVVVLASEKKNQFENCRFEGAVTGLEALFSNITVKNSSFESCGTGARYQDCILIQSGGGVSDCGTGVLIYDSEVDLREMNIYGNKRGIIVFRSSVYLTGATISGNEREALQFDNSRVKVSGNIIHTNGSGITMLLSEGSVSVNRLYNNVEYGMSLSQSRIKINGNEITGNKKFGLRVDDGKGVAWGNAIFANGVHDLYNNGSDDFKAVGNWWGTDSNGDVARRIFDQRSDANRGRVMFHPVLHAKPFI